LIDIDAGDVYLVAVDGGGYLSIITYSNRSDDATGLAGWAIALISSAIFCIVVIGVVIVIVRRRKRRQALAAANEYTRFNNPVPTQQNLPNNQGFNVNTQATANQGWNANQGAWNNNQPQPQIDSPPPTGQDNQANNWS